MATMSSGKVVQLQNVPRSAVNHAKLSSTPLGFPSEFSNEKAVLEELLRQWAVPGRWTSGNASVDRFGILVAPKSRVACAFCVVGGVVRYSKTLALSRKIRQELSREASRLFDMSPIGVNDGLGFEAIKKVVEARLAIVNKQQ